MFTSLLLAMAATVSLAITPQTVQVGEYLNITATITGPYSGPVMARVTNPTTNQVEAFFYVGEGPVEVKDGETKVVRDHSISSSKPNVSDFQLGLVGSQEKEIPTSIKVRVTVTLPPSEPTPGR